MPLPESLKPIRRRLRFYGALTESLSSTAVQCAMHGRTHPEWPLSFELAMAFLRVAAGDYYDFGVALARKRVSPISPSVRRKTQLTRGRLAGLEVDIHTARGVDAGAPTILFLHGGGYVTCSPRSHRDIIARIAASARARCIAPDYRLAPEHPYPAALDDALACYRALLADGVSPRTLFVAGDSAGGGLAVALALELRAMGLPLPRGLLLMSPWLDLTLTVEGLTGQGRGDYIGARSLAANAMQYAGRRELDHPSISPLFADLTGLPPISMETGAWEILYEQNLRFADKARAAGVVVQHSVVPGMLHAFPCFSAVLPQGVEAVDRVGRFVRETLTHN